MIKSRNVIWVREEVERKMSEGYLRYSGMCLTEDGEFYQQMYKGADDERREE